jgi:hypothetical protein
MLAPLRFLAQAGAQTRPERGLHGPWPMATTSRNWVGYDPAACSIKLLQMMALPAGNCELVSFVSCVEWHCGSGCRPSLLRAASGWRKFMVSSWKFRGWTHSSMGVTGSQSLMSFLKMICMKCLQLLNGE